MLNIFSRFVDANERIVKRMQPIVEEINALGPEFANLSDDEIRQRMIELRAEIVADAAPTEPSP